MKFTPVCKVHIQRRGGNAGLLWSVAPIDPTCSLPLLPDGELLYVAEVAEVAEEAIKVTPAMIGAAHDVTMKEAGLILSHELITKIYEAMSALAEQPEVKPKVLRRPETP
jgi:hypothetical protein